MSSGVRGDEMTREAVLRGGSRLFTVRMHACVYVSGASVPPLAAAFSRPLGPLLKQRACSPSILVPSPSTPPVPTHSTLCTSLRRREALVGGSELVEQLAAALEPGGECARL